MEREINISAYKASGASGPWFIGTACETSPKTRTACLLHCARQFYSIPATFFVNILLVNDKRQLTMVPYNAEFAPNRLCLIPKRKATFRFLIAKSDGGKIRQMRFYFNLLFCSTLRFKMTARQSLKSFSFLSVPFVIVTAS